jgi:hypothetical protein
MKAIGRPPSFNEAMKREVVRLVSEGLSVRMAARRVGCAEGTVRYARKHDPRFAQQFEQAGADREMELLRIIREAAKDPRQWQAGAWWLERMFPERYAPCKGRGIASQQLVERLDQFFDDIEGRLPAGLHQSLHCEFQGLMRQCLLGKFDGLLDEDPLGPADDLADTPLDASPLEPTTTIDRQLSHLPEPLQILEGASSVMQPSERPASAMELEAIVPHTPPFCAKTPGCGRQGEVGRPAPNAGEAEEPRPKGVPPHVCPQIPPSCAKSPGSGWQGEVGRRAPNAREAEKPRLKGVPPHVSPQIPPFCVKSPRPGRRGEVGRPGPNRVSPRGPALCGKYAATGPLRETTDAFGRSRERSRARAPP